MKQIQRRSAGLIESLESRTFLSATPAAYVAPVGFIAATKVKATIPSIASRTYTGTVTSKAGNSATLSISFSSESKGGALHASLTVDGAIAPRITGSINAHNKLALHGKLGKVSVVLTAVLSADTSTITGKYVAIGAKTNVHGTFTLTDLIA